MFGILIAEPAKPKGIRQRLTLLFFKGYFEFARQKAGKAPFMTCRVCYAKNAGQHKLRLLMEKGMQKLKQQGVFRIVCEEQWRQLAIECKLAPVSCEAALKACGCKLVLAALKDMQILPKTASVLIYANRATKELGKLALKLGAKVKYIHVTCLCGQNSINTLLMHEIGIAESAAGQSFDAAIIYDRGCFADPKIPAINLCGEHISRENTVEFGLSPPEEMCKVIPGGVDPSLFCSAAYLCGGIGAKDIGFSALQKSKLDITADTQYNIY